MRTKIGFHTLFVHLATAITLYSIVVQVVYCADSDETTTTFTTTLIDTTDATSNSVDDGSDDPCQDLSTRDNFIEGVLCRTHSDCEIFDQLCCPAPEQDKRVCVKPLSRNQVVTHSPLLGVIPRECPLEPLPEPLAVRNCSTDADCWPRICCPDGNNSYCRTPQPPWQRLSTRPLLSPLRNMMAYMQCTPPPPPLYDLFPKECRSMIDCFPNLCCQERDRKVCRPPRKSLLSLISNLGAP